MRRREAIRKQQAKFIEENGVICLDNVSKSYSTGSPALNGISLKVHRGSSYSSWVTAAPANPR